MQACYAGAALLSTKIQCKIVLNTNCHQIHYIFNSYSGNKYVGYSHIYAFLDLF